MCTQSFYLSVKRVGEVVSRGSKTVPKSHNEYFDQDGTEIGNQTQELLTLKRGF